MDTQQILALTIVALAAIYLGRNLWHAARNLLSGESGCGSGCGKCVFAAELKSGQGKLKARKDTIPLEIRTR